MKKPVQPARCPIRETLGQGRWTGERRERGLALVKRSRLGQHASVALGWTIALVAGLAIAFAVLNRKARGSNYDRFRNHRSRRKYRVPISEVEHERANDEGTA